MTLKNKILIGYGVTYCLMGLVVFWTVVNLLSLGKATNAILNENYRSIRAAENMVDAIERQENGILTLLLGNRPVGVTQFRENESNFLQWMARAKDNITIGGEAALVASIETQYTAYRERFYKLADRHEPDAKRMTETDYRASIQPLFANVRKACIDLRVLNEKTMYAASARASGVARQAIWSTGGVAAATLVIALSFSLLLAQRIVRPLRQFMEASRRISRGDYAVTIDVATRDELGHLAKEFNRMATQLDHYHTLNIDQIVAERNKGEAILTSIEDGLIVFDVTLCVTAINPAARRLVDPGFSEASRLCCKDILPDPSVCDMIRGVVETGTSPAIPDEKRILTMGNGEQSRHYLFAVTPILGKDRSLSGAVLSLRDVTRLWEVERLKNEFIMAASHELRTPLTSMGMSVELLMEHCIDNLPQRDRELLRAANEEVLRMKVLVNDLLDLSRIEAGRIDLAFARVPVSTLFEHVKMVFKNQLEAKSVALAIDFRGALPPVRADANKITWVLTNLVSNALRYVANGGNIKLRAECVGPLVHVSVRDDGPGIPREYHTRIFQKFVRVNPNEPGGSGLGLAICKEIVRAHGGTIWVESSPGQGTTFTFTLPAFEGDSDGKQTHFNR